RFHADFAFVFRAADAYYFKLAYAFHLARDAGRNIKRYPWLKQIAEAVNVTVPFSAHDVKNFFCNRVAARRRDSFRVNTDRLRYVARTHRGRYRDTIAARAFPIRKLSSGDHCRASMQNNHPRTS